MTDCQGTWIAERQLGETPIRVHTCSDCRELWAIDGTRHAGIFPRGSTDEEIVAAAIRLLHDPTNPERNR